MSNMRKTKSGKEILGWFATMVEDYLDIVDARKELRKQRMQFHKRSFYLTYLLSLLVDAVIVVWIMIASIMVVVPLLTNMNEVAVEDKWLETITTEEEKLVGSVEEVLEECVSAELPRTGAF